MKAEEYAAMAACEERHWWYVALREWLFQRLAEVYPKTHPSNLRLADVGCGTGMTSAALASQGFRVFSADPSPHAVRFAKERGLEQVETAMAQRLPWEDASFDGVIFHDVAYLLDDATLTAALLEISRVLRRGGHLFCQWADHEWLRSAHDDAVGTVKRRSHREMKAFFKAAGFSVERITPRYFLPSPAMIAVKLLRRSATGSDVTPPPKHLNALLTALMQIENALAKHIDLPFGISAYAILRKP